MNLQLKHNIRGWLTDINNVTQDLTGGKLPPPANDDLFAFRIQYNTLEFVGGIAQPPGEGLYNGNIAQTFWRTSSDNKLRGYFYEYDQLNRLQKAHYAKVGMGVSFFPGAYDEQLTYDRNGNILSLLRHTGDANENQIGMDNLAYTYQNGNQNSNRLMKVTDAVSGSSTGGFSNGSSGTNNDYTYDDNGNMISDLNKGITEILYNHLNLPTLISFANGNSIEYLYNAAGIKIEKKVHDTQNNTIKQVEYIDGFQYAGGVLQFFPTAEGYVAATPGGIGPGGYTYIFNYVYNYTDHLGNIRLSYTKDPVSGDLEIMEENHYYPFGLKHAVYADPKQMYKLDEEEENLARPTYVYETEYQYKYNGKEWQDELGLGWYDYQARNYDPALGRWVNVDPLAEVSRRFTPYAYALNNPVYFIDPDGMKATDWVYQKNKGVVYDSRVKTQGDAVEFYGNDAVHIKPNSQYVADTGNSVTLKNDGYFTVNGTESKARDEALVSKFNLSEGISTLNPKDDSKYAGAARTAAYELAEGLQDYGDGVALAGYGATVTGVGAPVGVPTATAGNIMSTIGSGMEILLNITDDKLDKAGQSAGFMIAGEVIDAAIEKAIPGPDTGLGKTILKQNAQLKVQGTERIVEHYQQESK